MLFAIHVHPHDVRDEGAAQVVSSIVERTGIRTIVAEAVTSEERHPYPRGVLPHNPYHPVVVSRAALEVPLPRGIFADLPVRPRLSAYAVAGRDYLDDLCRVASAWGVSVVPWVKALNGSFEGFPEGICVRTVAGEPVPTWLCPARPETAEYVLRLTRHVLERHPSRAVLLDRLRFPDWSGTTVGLERMLTCFCDWCRMRMCGAGIDVPRLIGALRGLRRDPRRLLAEPPSARTGAVIAAWLTFRQSCITELAGRIRARLGELDAGAGVGAALWFNLWPPSFARLMGQDYQSLGALCDGAKHFPYHRLGGGADLAGLIEAVAGDGDPALREKAFAVLLRLLRLPYELSFARFVAAGLPVEFVAAETAAAKEAFGHGKSVFSGVQIWDTPIEEIGGACRAAAGGGADGIFFYCYGWATLPALDAAGAMVRDLA